MVLFPVVYLKIQLESYSIHAKQSNSFTSGSSMSHTFHSKQLDDYESGSKSRSTSKYIHLTLKEIKRNKNSFSKTNHIEHILLQIWSDIFIELG
jgi:hypothetical protein